MEPAEKKEENSDTGVVDIADNQPEQEGACQESGSSVHTESPDTSSGGGSSLQKELDAKTEECQVLNDKFLRLAAEFENYKKRSQREQGDTVRFANEKILKDLLPTIDNLERALQCGQEQSSGNDGLFQGVELTHKQLMDTLSKLGVSQISSKGERFDPNKHQAVANVESTTVPEQHVVDEYQKGYFLNDRILRPAMVTVATASSQESSTEKTESSE